VDNKTVARALYKAFGRDDADTVLGSLAADVDWREAETQPYADTDTAQMSRILG